MALSRLPSEPLSSQRSPRSHVAGSEERRGRRPPNSGSGCASSPLSHSRPTAGSVERNKRAPRCLALIAAQRALNLRADHLAFPPSRTMTEGARDTDRGGSAAPCTHGADVRRAGCSDVDVRTGRPIEGKADFS
ncbi:hypothetical protein MRX96_048412 [Rhipicephalus microplus]